MTGLLGVSDADLLARLPTLVLAERERTADVIEHLVEIDRRRLFLDQACRSLAAYCIERLGYSEDEAGKRVRIARAAHRFPQVLDALRTGDIHLTGLSMLVPYLTEDTSAALLEQARGKSKRAIEELLASRFPRPDVPDRVRQVPEQTMLAVPDGVAPAQQSARPGTEMTIRPPAAVKPLSSSRWEVQFTASTELRDKIERAQELLSHAVPSGDLAELFDRALDALIERETKRRMGAGKPRKSKPPSPDSRHVPVEVARQVWERDGGQCTFSDEKGNRCSSRRFITLEHKNPYALGGPPTVENLCLLCWSHNEHAARSVFGEAHLEAKQREREETAESHQNETRRKAHLALKSMGFRDAQVRRVLARLTESDAPTELDPLIRAALGLLVQSR